jgi:hypothetical protein
MRSIFQKGILHSVSPPKLIYEDGSYINFRQAPSNISWALEPVYLYEDELVWSGKWKSRALGWRIQFELEFKPAFDIINLIQFLNSIYIKNPDAEFTFYISQNDVMGWKVKLASAIELGYIGDKYIAHNLKVKFKGTEILNLSQMMENFANIGISAGLFAPESVKNAVFNLGVGCFASTESVYTGGDIYIGEDIFVEQVPDDFYYQAQYMEASDYQVPNY